jgi:hypothetical protein
MTDSNGLTISLAITPKEKTATIEFIETEMRRSFGCNPPPTHGVIWTARTKKNIVGSLVLQGIQENGQLSLENHYEFDELTTPFPFNRDQLVQASRWIATEKGVSLSLLCASFAFAYALGKRYALIEAKPYSVVRLKELGFTCEEISGAKLLHKKIQDLVGEAGMSYFSNPPFPTLYMIDLHNDLLL